MLASDMMTGSKVTEKLQKAPNSGNGQKTMTCK
jgi:hypothetical protein